jgi:hypothetical protein
MSHYAALRLVVEVMPKCYLPGNHECKEQANGP